MEKTEKFQIPELGPQTTYVMFTTPVSVKSGECGEVWEMLKSSPGKSMCFPRKVKVNMKIVNQEMTRFNERQQRSVKPLIILR